MILIETIKIIKNILRENRNLKHIRVDTIEVQMIFRKSSMKAEIIFKADNDRISNVIKVLFCTYKAIEKRFLCGRRIYVVDRCTSLIQLNVCNESISENEENSRAEASMDPRRQLSLSLSALNQMQED